MLRYLLKRLLLMIPTLFGITIVTFGLVHLMPGKPGEIEEAMRKGVNPEVLEAQRRRFFLDLPLFVNFGVQDGPAAISEIVDRSTLDAALSKEVLLSEKGDILTEEELRQFPAMESGSKAYQDRIAGIRERGRKLLISRGGAAIPVVFGRYEELFRSVTPEEADLFFAQLTRSPNPKPEEASSAKERWQQWWTQNQNRFTPDYAAQKAEDYVAKAQSATGASARAYLAQAPELVKELTVLNSLAYDALIGITQDSARSDAEAAAAAALLSELTQISYSFSPDDIANGKYEEIDAKLTNWKEWWKQYRRDYATFSGTEKVFGIFSETQYSKWLWRIVTFEFGVSQVQVGRPVLDILTEALPKTLQLALCSLLLSYLISIPIGVIAARNQGSLFDRATTVILFIFYSLPSFFVALMLIYAFCGQGFLDWFPVTGLESRGAEDMPFGEWLFDRIWHMVLPVICLTYGSLASLSRYQRVGMLDVVRQDFIRTARAKGLSERIVIWKHAFRNSLLPVITLLGLQIPFLVGGSVIIEEIFQINGMGHETFKAIATRDYPVVMAVTVMTAIATMLALLISDILYAFADPRISYDK